MRKGYMAIRLAFQNFSSLGTKECTMLVLTRKAKEEIRIGNDITVTIVRVKGQSVRVGINAPEHVHVMRSELITPNDSGTDGRGSRRQRRDGSAYPDGGSVAGGSAELVNGRGSSVSRVARCGKADCLPAARPGSNSLFRLVGRCAQAGCVAPRE